MKRLVLCIWMLCASGCGFAAGTTANSTNEQMSQVSEQLSGFFSDMWLTGADMMRILWRDCSKIAYELDTNKKDFVNIMLKCMRKKTLRALDRTLNADIISLGQGVDLVKYQRVDKRGKVIGPAHIVQNYTWTKNEANGNESYEWKYMVLDRMAKVFNTHVLKVSLQPTENKEEIAEFRHRRRNQMMQMMMFGILSMGMIVVPMGFQFLAVLGGKALLLSKLALILSSIQGLKKVSGNPMNYGLYHSSYPSTSFDGNFEKRGYDATLPTPVFNKLEELPPVFEVQSSDKIAYRFDSDNKMWKPQLNRPIKRSSLSSLNDPEVYPVYGITPSYENYENMNQQYAALYSGYQTPAPFSTPAEIQAEYTIDLPVNKVQLKTSSPFRAS